MKIKMRLGGGDVARTQNHQIKSTTLECGCRRALSQTKANFERPYAVCQLFRFPREKRISTKG